jgi:hypothetical protein
MSTTPGAPVARAGAARQRAGLPAVPVKVLAGVTTAPALTVAIGPSGMARGPTPVAPSIPVSTLAMCTEPPWPLHYPLAIISTLQWVERPRLLARVACVVGRGRRAPSCSPQTGRCL